MNKKIWAIIALIIILPIVWYLISPIFIDIELDEQAPVNLEENKGMIILEGNFKPGNHDVAGKALIIDTRREKVLRFEDFKTINGPDLFIYLSLDLTNDDFVDLGRIKATKGNINYNLPENIDLTKYNKVLIWCRAFRVLFSYAELEKED